jgi:hypothetical protein
MRALLASAIISVAIVTGAATLNAANSSSNPGNCKVVEQPANTGSTGMNTSVTAGGGSVSAHTSGPGKSVTVHSGDGGSSSSVATAGASGQATVVTGTGGDCTIVVPPGKKDESK